MPAKLNNQTAKQSDSDQVTLEAAVAALRAGELVVYPTETFYALGVDATSAPGLARLFAAKLREAGKPVGLIVADLAMAEQIAEMPAIVRRLAEAFWPGPLTMVLPPRAGFPGTLQSANGIGLRVSPNPVARALAQRLGGPITATSANLAGGPPATTVEEARAAFGGKVGVYLDGGRLRATAASTVIAFEGNRFCLLRAGAIPKADIAAALGDEVRA